MKAMFWKQAVSGLLAAVCAASPLLIPAAAEEEALSTTRIPGGTYLAEKQGENVYIERIWTYECPANPGHKHTIAFHNAEPTCTESDYICNYCTLCGERELYVEKAALGHDYRLSSEENGVRIYTCSRCGAGCQEPIPRLPVEEAGSKIGNRDSGSPDMEKLSPEEITRLLDGAPLRLSGDVFDVEPSVNAPYAAGKVSAAALQAALDRLNAMRRIAGLPGVALDAALSQNAQYGAVLMAHLNGLSHSPLRPADMDERFYAQAKSAASSSNLSAGRNLPGAVDAFMDDSDTSNISSLGHRRWQLNPALGKVGFGYAVSGTGYGSFVVEKIFDKSGGDVDYDFISWPASGSFPAEIFDGGTAWSITLNPKLYETPDKSGVTVTLTRDSDGKTWTFRSGAADGFFNVNTSGYGVSNCIIFRPDGVGAYEGSYTVRVQGLKTQNGKAVADFTYQVDFFSRTAAGDPSSQEQPEKEQPSDPAGQGTPASSFPDVPAGHWAGKAIETAAGMGIVAGYDDGAFHPSDTVTNAQFNTMLARAFYPEDMERAQAGGSWWTPGVVTNQARGILEGTCLEEQRQTQGGWGDRIDAAISRYDMAQMMYNILKDHDAPLPAKAAMQAAQGRMTDWERVPEKYRDAVTVCYALGLLAGQENGAFGGGNSMDRAQGCVVICALLEYLAG